MYSFNTINLQLFSRELRFAITQHQVPSLSPAIKMQIDYADQLSFTLLKTERVLTLFIVYILYIKYIILTVL